MYDDVLTSVCENDEFLRRNHEKSPYAATTVNMKGEVICDDHTDSANLPFGWCRITPFGPFNYRRGGHMVLWDLGIAIEFPPGTTIYIPSALLVHSNLLIGEGEKRYSITSYSGGGLFRWIWNGGQTDEHWEEEATEEEIAQREWFRDTAWDTAMQYFPLWP